MREVSQEADTRPITADEMHGLPSAEELETPPPERIGRYRIRERIGAGGMGVVYSALDPELDRLVAIKVLNGARGDASWSSEGPARLLREAQAMAHLSDPHVIEVFDFGRVGDGVFVAMEFVAGTTLRRWLAQPRPVEEILRAYVRAGQGLAAAHASGLVHRDFKPDNVLMGDDGRIRVADFGLARPSGGTASEASMRGRHSSSGAAPVSIDAESLTAAGTVMGTPMFMAPEQHDGEIADERCDQYAFCVALYSALYGRTPFTGSDTDRLAMQKRAAEIDWARGSMAVPTWVVRVLRRGLSPDPGDRWPSMFALLERLRPDKGRGATRWVPAVAVVALASAASLTMVQADAQSDGECDRGAQAWSPERRAAVQGSLSRGSEASASALQSLDAYAAAWSGAWAATCDADPDPTLEGCLGRQRARFDAITERLVELSESDLHRAGRVVSGLAPVRDCIDAAASGGRPLPPAELSAAVDAVDAQLEKAVSFEVVGRPREGLPVADEAVRLARQVDFAPVLAEALYRQGRLRRAVGDGEASLEAIIEAAHIAEANRLDKVAANASIEAMTTLGLTLQRTDEALEWARTAEAAVKRLGPGTLEEARLQHHEGIVRARAGDFERALELMRSSLALRRKLQGDADVDVATNLLDLGALLGDMSRHEDAYATSLEALAVWEKAAGPRHQFAAFAHMNIGSELMALHRLDEALPQLTMAYEILTEVLGEDHPSTISALNNLGTLHQRAGRLDQALVAAERVLELRVARFGNDHRETARAHGNLTVTLIKLERLDEARRHAETSLRMLERAPGEEHPDLVSAHKVLAEILTSQGEPQAALPHHEEAIRLARVAFGDDNFQVGRMFASRAATLLELGRFDAVIEDAMGAIERFEGKQRHAGREGEVRFILAKAHWSGGDHERARAQALIAKERLTAADREDDRGDLMADCDAWLQSHPPAAALSRSH